MPLSHLHDLTDDVLARAARIRLACFDVDGTLTDGRLYLDSEGREQKTFHVQDGQGLDGGAGVEIIQRCAGQGFAVGGVHRGLAIYLISANALFKPFSISNQY